MKPNFFLAASFWCAAIISSSAAPLPQTQAIPSVPATYGSWRSSQIGGGGYVQNIVPTSNPLVYYTHIDVGGAYRSDDGGHRWRMIHGGLPPMSGAVYEVRGLSMSATNPDDVLIACGSEWTPQAGLFRSLDGGKTWKYVQAARFYGNAAFRWTGLVLARNPKNSAQVWAASGGDGLLKSSDGGAIWTNAGLKDHFFTDIKFDRANPNRMWAAAQPQKLWRDGVLAELRGGWFLSEDGGQTWKTLADVSPTEFVQDAQSGNTLFGIFAGRKISRSTDGGATWTNFSDGLPVDETKEPANADEAGFNALATGPDFIVTASSRGTFYRLNAGQTRWQKVERQGVTEQYEGLPWHSAMGPGKWQHFGAALGSITVDPRDPKHWFFSDWFAIYQSRDAGLHWSLSMDGVEVTVLHALAPDPTDSGVVHLGMADNGYFVSENGGARFDKPEGPSNCKTIAVSPSLPSRIYATGDAGNGQWRAAQIWVSADRGRSWTRSPMTGLPDMNGFSCNSIAVAPDDPFTAYVTVSKGVKEGEGGVYKSVDGGKTWSWMGEGLPAGQELFAHNIWSIGREIAAGENGVLSAISRDGKSVFHFDGTRWTLAQTFQHSPMSVVAGSANTFWAGVRDEGVYKSTDGGKSWNLSWRGDTAHVAVDVSNPQHLAAGVNDGAVLSLDGGATWKSVDSSLPYKTNPIVALSGDRLYAGTFGSGAFWTPISDAGKTRLTAKPLRLPQIQPLQMISNGAMNEGAATPTGWNLWAGAGTPKLSRDTLDFQAGPTSLRLDGGTNTYGSASQALTIPKMPFSISGFLKTTAGVAESNVAIQVMDGANKQIDWIPLSSGPLDKWTRWEKTVTLPPNAASASLTATIRGEGTVWLDEIEIQGAPDIWKPAVAER